MLSSVGPRYEADLAPWGRGSYLCGMRRTRFALISVVISALAIVLVACAKEKPAAPPKTVSDYFPIKVGDKTVRMQLAVLQGEQERGLMDRRDLGHDDGMLFVYQTPQQMHYWMHNTPTALDIGFFDADGILREIYPMQPFDESTISSRRKDLKYALEMNQGWFHEAGVRPGATLDMKALAAALKERGFAPRKFGME